MVSSEILSDRGTAHGEPPQNDIQWSKIVELDFVPPPNGERPEIALLGFPMREGRMKWGSRAVLAGCFLHMWSMNCLPGHRLRGPEHRLWVGEPLAFYEVRSATMAPGYISLAEKG